MPQKGIDYVIRTQRILLAMTTNLAKCVQSQANVKLFS